MHVGNELGAFSWRVIDVITRLIERSGMTDAELIRRSGMRRNTFYVKMRGETAMTTEDIAKIADGLGVDPMSIMLAASRPATDVGGSADADDLDNVSYLGRAEVEADLELRPAANTRTRKADREPFAE